ncbi:MAG TPA: TIGR01777 family oxidoreductase, partial [Terriglobales bacterium]|nr:TIGR01777 family oxidoreductase [Terriglobales bacterium]
LVITGATGFIGSPLCSRLLEQGHTLTLLTRSAPRSAAAQNKRWLHWTPGASGVWEKSIDGADGIINLAGEPLAASRWTPQQKQKIRMSRIEATNALVDAAAKAEQRPRFLINASAVGYYGPRGDELITEGAAAGTDFLAETTRDWENEAMKAKSLGVRVVCLRSGMVLGSHGGALAKMVPPFKLFIGGPLGSGKQWISWIHMEDEVGLILHLAGHAEASGPVNATAPNPVTMKEFCRTLGQVLGRPCWAPVPALALRLLLGEMAEMVLTGQKVIPAAAEKWGYQFRYPYLEGALQACMPL